MFRRSLEAVMVGATVLALSACVDGRDPLALEQGLPVALYATPVFALEPSEAEIADLDVIRITLRDASTGQPVLPPLEEPIDPSQPEWAFELSLELDPGDVLSLRLETELLDTDDGLRSVEWSGLTNPFSVHASLEPFELRQVELYRGPLANHRLEGITLGTTTLSLRQGASTTLDFMVLGDTAGTVLYFGSTDETVATVDGSGRVSTHGVGSADVVVFAGPVRDSLALEVSEVVLPALAELESTVIPHLDYVASDLFLGTLHDPTGAASIGTPTASLAVALRAGQGPEAVGLYEEIVAAWAAYGAGSDLRFVDGPQLGVVELMLILVANTLHTELP